MVEYIVAIDVTRVRFPDDALLAVPYGECRSGERVMRYLATRDVRILGFHPRDPGSSPGGGTFF